MFRGPRRMMRRAVLAGAARGGRGQQMIQQAQALMAEGKFAEAAKLCTKQSREAAQRGLVGPAARLSLIATRAFVQAKQPGDALTEARQALDLMLIAGNPQRATRAIPTVIAFMRANGFTTQAAALEKEAADRLAKVNLKLGQPFGQAQGEAGSIPASCPNCGGALRSDTAEWIDATSVECPWCGSTVKSA